MKVGKVALGELARVRTGKLDANASSPNGKYPFFTCAINPLRIDTFSYECECVLVAGNGDLNVKYHNGRFDAYQRTYIVEPISESLDCRYLYHFLDSYLTELRKLSIGGVIKYIKLGNLTDAQIPLPPLEEQRRIAAILDKASRIAELCSTALKLSHAADKSLFLHFFADLPEESNLLLEELAGKRSNAIRTGPFGSQLLHSEFTDSGVAVLGIDNAVNNSFEWSKRRFISHDKYEQLKRYTVFPGDLLVTIMGTCGRAAVVPDDIPQAINTKHLCAISVDRSIVLPDYLHSYILFHPSASRYLGQRTKGAIMEGLNMTIIKEMPVAVPPISHQMAWLARRRILRSASKSAQSMSASALSLRQSFSYNLLEERGA